MYKALHSVTESDNGVLERDGTSLFEEPWKGVGKRMLFLRRFL